MEFVLLGWPSDGPTLRLDYRRFAYAGKFVMSNTGKAVVSDRRAEASAPSEEYESDVLAAVAFNEDRTDESTLWLRYVTVRDDRKGENLGPELCSFVVAYADERGYERLRIAVNNPFAYEALYEAGFAWTEETTGIAELVLERPAEAPADRRTARYQRGLDEFRERDLSGAEAAFLDDRRGSPPPEPTASEAVRDSRGVDETRSVSSANRNEERSGDVAEQSSASSRASPDDIAEQSSAGRQTASDDVDERCSPDHRMQSDDGDATDDTAEDATDDADARY